MRGIKIGHARVTIEGGSLKILLDPDNSGSDR